MDQCFSVRPHGNARSKLPAPDAFETRTDPFVVDQFWLRHLSSFVRAGRSAPERVRICRNFIVLACANRIHVSCLVLRVFEAAMGVVASIALTKTLRRHCRQPGVSLNRRPKPVTRDSAVHPRKWEFCIRRCESENTSKTSIFAASNVFPVRKCDECD